ncbi:hypothetical protein MCUN1_001018 [Malassezia cuniculi]|uniref:DNA ligase n=1 Tax=Malassezia cuniculi TaxID=948313 RepID=A0AAF0ETN9_9BASI|nr:hypothetical protein MCUN1_001018 [Malassezia cuniculi]
MSDASTAIQDGDSCAGAQIIIGDAGEEYVVYPALALAIGDSHVREDGSASSSAQSTPRKRHRSTNAPIYVTIGRDTRQIGTENERLRVLLAGIWNTSRDPTGWWISEKLDGVRAFWDGSRLWSRRGREWAAPPWWLEQLPEGICLDGELWISRGTFERVSAVCRSNDHEWTLVKYMVRTC